MNGPTLEIAGMSAFFLQDCPARAIGSGRTCTMRWATTGLDPDMQRRANARLGSSYPDWLPAFYLCRSQVISA
jgi:hypothetical protein